MFSSCFNLPVDECYKCVAWAIKRNKIEEVKQQCCCFEGFSCGLSNLEAVNDEAWWFEVQHLAPTVLFHTARSNTPIDHYWIPSGITLKDLPSHIRSLFPMPKKLKSTITETLRRCGFDYDQTECNHIFSYYFCGLCSNIYISMFS